MPRLPDLEAMAIFARIVELRGIGAAAVDLGLSTPTVSKSLARLEQRLGARLFNRTSRRLVLTEAGQRLAERAARLLADAEAAEAALREDAATPQGPVRLGAPMSFGVSQVAPLLPAFLARYPGVTVDLHLSDARVDLIADGFDALLRIGPLVDSSLRVRRLAPVARLVAASPAYLDRHGRPGHPADLRRHACINYAYTGVAAWLFENRAGEVVTVTPGGPLTINNGEAMLPALLAGIGIAVLPAFILGDMVAEGRLERVLPDWHAPDSTLHLLTAPGGPRPARVGALVDFLVERLAA
ncbi:LysR family transcriptional regulator [Rhodopila sp.]|jgi:DNA-binding transcriptional LysR family regulator|uniref:LysR family transcriptional regulator n=1 Tax=Rhodopila sp. TaxID=2480087 RepID=UPI002BDA9E53|nr:LysR family transcriptional regulator [Rhodopila sp.]HVZ09825.1 LysR family transcriptional regulator [Rhodopila sp.]